MPKDVITSEVSFAQHLARLQRRLRQVEKLAPQEKRQVATLLDAFIERAQLKQARR